MRKQIPQFELFLFVTLTSICFESYAQSSWSITGNSTINATTNFLGTTNNRPIVFRTNNVERMRLLGGNLGIGTVSPQSRLHIVSSSAVSLASGGYFILGNTQNYNLAMDRSYIQARYNGTAADLYLNYYGGTVYAGYYNLSYWGLVGAGKYMGLYGYSYDSSGIGTYGYSSLWHGVYGYTGGGLGSDPQGSSGVYGYNASYGYGVGGYCYGGAGVYAYSEYYDGLFARGNPGWYAGFFLGDVYSTGSFIPSDAGLKQNIKDVASAMDIINRLHAKQYEYRQDGNYKLMNLPKGNRFGLIADDVEKVLPGLVKEARFNTKDAQPPMLVDPKDRSSKTSATSNETIDFKALNYTELIPLIIKGMQEQQSVIQRQQAVIDKQQQQIDDLKKSLQNIVAAISPDAKATDVSTGAYLITNTPNPFSDNTTIKCYVPSSVKQAQLAVYNMDGKLMKSYTLSGGMNNVNIMAGSLAAGQYTYALLADGKKVDAKNMIITK